MVTKGYNVIALEDLYGSSIVAGMAPTMIISPMVFKTEYTPGVIMFVTALCLKKIGLL